MAKICITNLRLRTIIGVYDWEKKKKQGVIINVTLEYDAKRAAKSDKIKDTLDYKEINKSIIRLVEQSKCELLERLAGQVLDLVLSFKGVRSATVKIDKPGALRFADSVSVEIDGKSKNK